jgi:hypothetical protein
LTAKNDKFGPHIESSLPGPNFTPDLHALQMQNSPQNSMEKAVYKFNPATNRMDVPDHFSLLHSNLSRNDAEDILEMANIAISRSQRQQRKDSKRNHKSKRN